VLKFNGGLHCKIFLKSYEGENLGVDFAKCYFFFLSARVLEVITFDVWNIYSRITVQVKFHASESSCSLRCIANCNTI
jgi:hypothetical protein